MSKALYVSYSAAQIWLACQERYWLEYVQQIKPRVKSAPMELGSVLHDGLETFYRSGSREQAIHKVKKHRAEAKKAAKIAASLDMPEKDVQALLAIPTTAMRLLKAYLRVHGENDLEQHKVRMVETHFNMKVKEGVYLPGKIDLVTEDDDGLWLWEHKTTGSIPRPDSRFRDLQTLIYRAALEELFDIQVCGVIWNYIRTRPPVMPAQLKKGTMSVRNITTTRELVLRAVKTYGLNKSDYQAYLRKVERRERQDMFARFQLPVVAKENILLRDYVQTVKDIEIARAIPNYQPVRTISAQCEWCSMKKLCQAAILGGETSELIRKHYTVGGGKKRGK